jgi:hypothetical protein
MILVLAIVVVLCAMAYPSLDSMFGGYKVSAGADMVRAAWADAQAYAIDEGRAYRFALTPYTGNFRVAPDDDSFWTGGSEAPSAPTSNSSEPALIIDGVLPKGAKFEVSEVRETDADMAAVAPVGNSGGGNWVTVAVFLPDGTAREDAEVRLTARGIRPMIMRLRGLTGVVTVKPGDSEGKRP